MPDRAKKSSQSMKKKSGLKAPNPFRGWARELENLPNAIVVPAESRAFTQQAGVLRADGSYCYTGALWRKHREITSEPQPPKGPIQKLPGRWLWGGRDVAAFRTFYR